jgi:hypothetical protein
VYLLKVRDLVPGKNDSQIDTYGSNASSSKSLSSSSSTDTFSGGYIIDDTAPLVGAYVSLFGALGVAPSGGDPAIKFCTL